MSKFCVGTMDTSSGWEVESPTEALSLHFTYWFTSRHSQGKVVPETPSFYYLWAKHGTQKEVLIDQTQIEFQNYLEELFPDSIVEVESRDVMDSNSNYNLIIKAIIISDGKRYDLARTILVTGEHYTILDDARLNNEQSF